MMSAWDRKKSIIRFILTGLLISFLISFFHIRYTNVKLGAFLTQQAIEGRMIVPNAHVLPSLYALFPVFSGAVFFVLTAGLAVILASLVSAQVFSRVFCREKRIRASYCLFWSFITIASNLFSVSPVTTLYTVLIPFCLVLSAPEQLTVSGMKEKTGFPLAAFFLSLTTVGTLFYLKADGSIFLRARDYLLLSNSPGNVLNDFYYAYSPYAVQALKKGVGPQNQTDASLAFLCRSGLIFGLPSFLGLILFDAIYFLSRKILPGNKPLMVTTGICIGLPVMILFYLMPPGLDPGAQAVKTMLNSPERRIRIEALRIVCRQSRNKDLTLTGDLSHLIHGNTAERYWLANALGVTKGARDLLTLMTEDRSVNVQCAAIRALARTGCDGTLQIFRDKMVNSRQWYVQQAAEAAYDRCRHSSRTGK